jgi:enoyl-[acyl-carrier-protein] reductase (NADH)
MLSFACIVTSSSQKRVLIRLWVMGFQIEKKKERFDLHIGKSNSSHNAARIKCENLMNEKQSIMTLLYEQTIKSQSDYLT